MNMRNKVFGLLIAATCAATLSLSVQARSWSGAYGGSASASWGSRSATDARGGSATWTRGEGTTVDTADGRSASTSATAWRTPAEGAAEHGYGYGADGYHPPAYGYGYHPPAYGYDYHPPSYGYSSGDVAAAGVAGMAVGAMAGAAAAESAAPPPSTVIVQESAPPPAYTPMPIGTTLYSLPSGCSGNTFNGIQYYQCGGNWMQTFLGSQGAYYQVVPAPY